MKHTLTLTGSSAALVAAMTAFEAVEGNSPSAALATATPFTSTGTGTPVAPAMPSAPSGATPMPTAPAPMSGTDDDSDDEADDGTPAGDGSGLDSNGLPWDERIHSSSKKRGQDGSWNKRRGGPKGADLAAIEMELRANQPSAPMPTAAPSAPPPPMPTAGAEQPQQPAPAPVPMPTADPTPPAPPPPPMPTATAMPAAEPPATPAMPVSAAPAAAPTGLDFPTLMQTIGPKMGEGAGQIDAGYLQQVCQVYGLNSLTDLALKPELIDAVVAQFAADGRW